MQINNAIVYLLIIIQFVAIIIRTLLQRSQRRSLSLSENDRYLRIDAIVKKTLT